MAKAGYKLKSDGIDEYFKANKVCHDILVFLQH